MSDEEAGLETAITQALEQQPRVTVPVDFAARVRAALPAQPRGRVRRFAGRSVSQTAATVAAVGLVAALCVLAPHARPSFESVAFDMEMLVLVELGLVVAWLGMQKIGFRD
jgi:hypothetical protein